jgi:glycosyltransferase involved in cell wall biosynthesis
MMSDTKPLTGPTNSDTIGRADVPSPIDLYRTLLSTPAKTRAVPGRVVIVNGSLGPGGAERQILNTITGLSTANLESISLLCHYLHGGTEDLYDFYLPRVQSTGAHVRPIRTTWERTDIEDLPAGFRAVEHVLHHALKSDVINLYREFRLLQPEVVHAWLDYDSARAGLAAILAGVPRIVLCGCSLTPMHFPFDADYYHPVYRALIERNGDQVVLINNSKAGADDYTKWLSLPPNQIRVVRNGVQLAKPASPDRANVRARFGIADEVPLIGGMFRLQDEKRPMLWLDAAERIARVLPDAHFIVFGAGPMQSQVEAVVRQLGIRARTHLCGMVTPAIDGLSICDLILLTSRVEGIPNVLLEAQGFGLPVVATDVGGVREGVTEETGLVIKSHEAGPIANAVIKIMNDRRFRERARVRGPEFIAERFGMSRMIDETLAAYFGSSAEPSRRSPAYSLMSRAKGWVRNLRPTDR